MEFKLWILLSPHCVLLISFASGLAAHREKRFTKVRILYNCIFGSQNTRLTTKKNNQDYER